jgi:hypothetical protein
MSGDMNATAGNGLNLSGANITLSAANGGISIVGGTVTGSAYQNNSGSGNTVSGNHSATAVSTLNISAANNLSLSAGGSGSSIFIASKSPYALASGQVAGSHNTASADGSVSLTAGGNLSINAANGGFLMQANSHNEGSALAIGRGVNDATANADVSLNAGGDITISAKDGITVWGNWYNPVALASGASSAAQNTATANHNVVIAAGRNLDLNVTGAGDIVIGASSAAAAHAVGNGTNTATAHGDTTLYAGNNVSMAVTNGSVTLVTPHCCSSSAVAAGGSSAAKNTAVASNNVSVTGANISISGGDLNLSHSAAVTARTSGSGTLSATNNANLTLNGNLTVTGGNLNISGGNATASGSGAVANANTVINASVVHVSGNMNLYGGSAFASGSGAVASADARISSTATTLDVNAGGNVWIQGGTASAGPGATASAVALIGGHPVDGLYYPLVASLTVGGDLTIWGGLPQGSGGIEYTYAGAASELEMIVSVGGNLKLVGAPGATYANSIWNAGTGIFNNVIYTVNGTVTIDTTTCPTCGPAFLQTEYPAQTFDYVINNELYNILADVNGISLYGPFGVNGGGSTGWIGGVGGGTGGAGGGTNLPSCRDPGEIDDPTEKGCAVDK